MLIYTVSLRAALNTIVSAIALLVLTFVSQFYCLKNKKGGLFTYILFAITMGVLLTSLMLSYNLKFLGFVFLFFLLLVLLFSVIITFLALKERPCCVFSPVQAVFLRLIRTKNALTALSKRISVFLNL